nr:putative zeta toxin domain, P-loop containing nucleoside triphosphate hydrolase [Tanacetum cinerariifolium]
MIKDGYGKLVVAHIVAASTAGFIYAAAVHRRRKNSKSLEVVVVPKLELTGSGHAGRLEKFHHYVARQLGFKDGNECPELSKLASDYVRSSKGFNDELYVYFSNEKDVESLCANLVNEFERCILGYFAFHWSQASLMINQVLSAGSDERKLKNMVLTATR